MKTKTPARFTLKELRSRIRNAYWKRTKPGKAQRRVSFGEDLGRTIEGRNRKPKVIPTDIKIWLALFDEAIGFWLLVWGVYRQILEEEKPVSKRSMCLVTLAGRTFQDMICVRNMIQSGFFIQSNVVTRSLIESIDVMHLINARPELAEEFRSVETNDEASKFWHMHCSRNKIHKEVRSRWHWLLETSPEVATAFHERRSAYLDLVGMSAYPTFAASLSSFMDRPKGRGARNIVYSAMGTVSHMSKFTIHLILLRTFEYGILWVGPEASVYKGMTTKRPVRFQKELSRCLSIVFSIIHLLDQSPGPDVFFPEFKTYWPRSNFDDQSSPDGTKHSSARRPE